MILDYGIDALSNPLFVFLLVVIGAIMWFSMKGIDNMLTKKNQTFCKGCGIPLIGTKWCKECWTIKNDGQPET